MGNSISQKLKYKQSVIKFSFKYGVTKAAIKFGESRRTIYRWIQRYYGTLDSLKDKSRRPHFHPNQHTEEEIKLIRNRGKAWRKEYNNFLMRPLGWLSPNEFLKKYKIQEESLLAI